MTYMRPSKSVSRSSMIDPVEQLIGLLKPESPTRCRTLIGRGEWAIAFPSERHRAVFGIVAEGSCWFDYPGSAPRRLEKGDFILLSEPPTWCLRSSAIVEPVDFRSTYDRAAGPTVHYGQCDGENSTSIIGGYFDFDGTNAALLPQLLPSVVVVRSGEETGWRLRSVLQLISDEVMTERKGRHLVLSRLLDILLVESLRLRTDEVAATTAGMLAGLADHRLAAAIRAVHADVRHPWSVGSLARLAGMSRSAFAALFRKCVGVRPAEYLVQWRMALAKEALKFTKQSLADVAAASGYRSASAFNTAFRRVVGCSPGAYGTKVRSTVA
jgi:AraC-like DNA-binding protein